MDLLEPYSNFSIIGMAKNVGKTTALGYFIEEYGKRSKRLGLTSIGRDGEDTDVVTKTEKPRIFVPKGTIIATAEKLLDLSDITKEILALKDVYTPLGRIVVVRSLSDGFVQLGGPSITIQIADLLKDLREFGVDKIIVDGAVGRKTLASPKVTEATILCTGASLNKNINVVVDETQHAVSILTLPKVDKKNLADEIDALFAENEKNIKSQKSIEVGKGIETGKITVLEGGHLYIQGALSDALVKDLVFSNTGICVIADDPSKVFIRPSTYEKLLIKKMRLMVRESINLVAVTVNPVSAYGINFNSEELLEKMSKAVSIPVYDLKEAPACLT